MCLDCRGPVQRSTSRTFGPGSFRATPRLTSSSRHNATCSFPPTERTQPSSDLQKVGRKRAPLARVTLRPSALTNQAPRGYLIVAHLRLAPGHLSEPALPVTTAKPLLPHLWRAGAGSRHALEAV